MKTTNVFVSSCNELTLISIIWRTDIALPKSALKPKERQYSASPGQQVDGICQKRVGPMDADEPAMNAGHCITIWIESRGQTQSAYIRCGTHALKENGVKRRKQRITGRQGAINDGR